MSDDWFFNQNFNLIEENFFDDVNLDPSLDDVNLDQSLNDIILEGEKINGENWEADFQSLQPPLPMFYGDCCSAGLEENQTISTASPVSVLESTSSCSGPAENPSVSLKLKKGTRSRRKRASIFNLPFVLPLSSSSSTGDGFYETESDGQLADKPSKNQKKKKNMTLLLGSNETKKSESEQVVRKCFHCGITKTPQWREGPNGPKTLCNACGVRYRSGRLVPEYRPAASPTFIPSLHSNSHRKIVEMRRKVEEMKKRCELHELPQQQVH